jgi:hypothetical protein
LKPRGSSTRKQPRSSVSSHATLVRGEYSPTIRHGQTLDGRRPTPSGPLLRTLIRGLFISPYTVSSRAYCSAYRMAEAAKPQITPMTFCLGRPLSACPLGGDEW